MSPNKWTCTICGRDKEALDGECDCGGSKRVGTIGKPFSALDVQVGGGHYRHLPIQPAAFVHHNNIPYLEGSVIYYVTRWREKGGLADIDKAIHTLQLIKELEHGKEKDTPDAT